MKPNSRSVQAFSVRAWRWIALTVVFTAAASIAAQQESREQQIQRGGETVIIRRGDYGAPHVISPSYEGIWFGQGYAAAEDRLWQMELFRRDAKGEFAEIGLWRIEENLTRDAAIAHDQWARRLGYSESEQRGIMDWLDEEITRMLRAYSEGVNAWIARAKAEDLLPAAYGRLGIVPRPWEPSDSLAISDLIAWRIGDGATRTLLALLIYDELIQEHSDGTARFNELFLLDDPSADTVIPANDSTQVRNIPSTGMMHRNNLEPGWTDREMLLEVIRNRKREKSLAAAMGLFSDWKGYAWLVSPGKLTTGNAMLVGVPMLGRASTSIVHEVHLTGPGEDENARALDVFGMAFAGMPTVIAGVNPWAAWLAVPGRGRSDDYYIEKIDVDVPQRYVFGNSWFAMNRRVEQVKIWKDAESIEEVELPVFRTFHGPVLAFSESKGQAITLRRAWWLEHMTYSMFKVFLQLDQMRSQDDFAQACRLSWSSLQFFYADPDGTIASQWSGRYPRYSREHDPRLPSMGRGSEEWTGYIDYRDLPKSVNPKKEYLAFWNTKPERRWVDWRGLTPRGRVIRRNLERKQELTPGELTDIARDLVDHDDWAALVQPHLAAIEGHTAIRDQPRMAEALGMMLEYDLTLRKGGIGQRLYEAFIPNLIRELFEQDFPMQYEELDPEFFLQTYGELMMRLLEPNRMRRVRGRRQYTHNRAIRDVLANALIKTVQALTERDGPSIQDWGHSSGSGHSEFGRGDDQVPSTLRSAWMLVVELGQPMRIQTILAPGQSENPASPHFNDQLDLWRRFQFKPIEPPVFAVSE